MTEDTNRLAWNMVLMTVLASVLGGVIGWTARSYNTASYEDIPQMQYGIGGGPGTTDANLPSDKMRLQYELDGIVQEHIGLSATVLDGIYDGTPRSSDLADLDDNSVKLADFIGDYYGQNARNVFLSRWRDHIQFYKEYATAKKTGDVEQADRARADLQQFAGTVAALLAQGNPNLPISAAQEAFQTHTQHILDIVDMHASDDVSGEQEAVSKARDHAKRMAVMIADAISKQFPNK